MTNCLQQMFNVISIRIDYRTNLWRDSEMSYVGQPSTPRAPPVVPLLPSPSSVTPGILSLATRLTPVIQVERIRIGQEMRSVFLGTSKTVQFNSMFLLFFSICICSKYVHVLMCDYSGICMILWDNFDLIWSVGI